jgi:hypothetical protein
MNRPERTMGSGEEADAVLLAPGPVDVSRRSSIEVAKKLREQADSPHFAADCDRFIGEYQDGDIVLEFCSSLPSWNHGMGQAGFLLLRNGRNVTSLVTRLSSPPFTSASSSLPRSL